MPFRPFSWPAGLFGSDEELYGRRPDVPESPDFGRIAGQQIQANIENLPSLRELAGLSTDALMATLERALPGYGEMLRTGTGAIQNLLSGQATDYERNTLRRLGAELGVQSGTLAGSDISNFRTLGLGIDYLNRRTEFGLSAAERWLAQAQNRTFDFTRMFIFDPFRQGEFEWQRDWLANQVAAAPDPAKRGAADAELTGVGIAAGIFGGNAYTGGRYSPSYGSVGGGSGAGGAGGGSFFGVGDYVRSSGGGAPGGGSFSDYYGSQGVNPYGAGGSPSLEGGGSGGFDFSKIGMFY